MDTAPDIIHYGDMRSRDEYSDQMSDENFQLPEFFEDELAELELELTHRGVQWAEEAVRAERACRIARLREIAVPRGQAARRGPGVLDQLRRAPPVRRHRPLLHRREDVQ